MAYTAAGTYNDAALKDDDKTKIAALATQYEQAKAQGNMSLADQYHAQAEQIRSGYNYSGGSDGSQYINKPQDMTGGTGVSASTLKPATSQEEYLNGLYKAKQEAALNSLKSAYDQNVIDVDAAAAKIPASYQTARNSTASTAAQNKAAFNEYAAGSGLNSGTGSQAQLAMNNSLQGDMSAINQAEADAKADIETERLKLSVDYNNAISQAIMDGDTEKAQALYNEKVRVDESLVSTSQNQAQLNASVQSQNRGDLETTAKNLAAYGDFSGYKALGYSDEQIANMLAVWRIANPDIAAAMGYGTNANAGSGPSAGGAATSSYAGGASNDTDVLSTSQMQNMIQSLDATAKNGISSNASTPGYIANAYASGYISNAQASALLRRYGYTPNEWIN